MLSHSKPTSANPVEPGHPLRPLESSPYPLYYPKVSQALWRDMGIVHSTHLEGVERNPAWAMAREKLKEKQGREKWVLG